MSWWYSIKGASDYQSYRKASIFNYLSIGHTNRTSTCLGQLYATLLLMLKNRSVGLNITHSITFGHLYITNSNNYSFGNHFFKVLVQIPYSHLKHPHLLCRSALLCLDRSSIFHFTAPNGLGRHDKTSI